MRFWAALVVILYSGLACASSPDLEPKAWIDASFDLDWTLFYTVTPDQVLAGDPRFIPVDGEWYRATDHVSEFFQVLLSLPGLRISFASGGAEWRNRELLRAVRLPEGSLEQIAHRILSKRELVPIPGVPENAHFPDRFKKDLGLISPGDPLNRTSHTDDVEDFALQSGHTLWIGRTFEFVEDYSRLSPRALAELGRYAPDSERAWALERNKLAWVLGIHLAAYEAELLNPGSYAATIDRLQRDSKGKRVSREDPSQWTYYQRGLEAMRQVNPALKWVGPRDLSLEGTCLEGFRSGSFSPAQIRPTVSIIPRKLTWPV